MEEWIAINHLAAQLGVSSRTLRYWEDAGLFTSGRDAQSGWRVYGSEALLRIRVTDLLRRMDIPIKDISLVLDSRDPVVVRGVVQKQLAKLDSLAAEMEDRRDDLLEMLNLLDETGAVSLASLEYALLPVVKGRDKRPARKEKRAMENDITSTLSKVAYIEMDKARTAAYSVEGLEPEPEAMAVILDFVKKNSLEGTARLFGFNVEPYPTAEHPAYGFGFCVTLPEGVEIPAPLHEWRMPGGVYARIEIPAGSMPPEGWAQFQKLIDSGRWEWEFDYSRNPAMEEHLRRGDGEGFLTNCLLPVKKRQE